jgi:hypothetical protein
MGNVRALGGHDERIVGFLYRPSTGARDVNELIDPALGYTIAYPQAVNYRQPIVGLGCKEFVPPGTTGSSEPPGGNFARDVHRRRNHEETRTTVTVTPEVPKSLHCPPDAR